MKVNLRPKTGEKRRSTSGPSNNNPNPNSSIDDFRNYITELESLLKDALYENIKLKYEKKSQSIEMKKQQQKADEIIKKYSVGKIYLDNFEKILNQTNLKLLALSIFLWYYIFCSRRVGQVVKTPPSHGGFKGSNPLRVTMDMIA